MPLSLKRTKLTFAATWIALAIVVMSLISAYQNKWNGDYEQCKTVETVGSCTRYDCRVGFTDETHGTLRGPALQGDLVCKRSFRDFWEMTNETHNTE